MYSFLTVTIDKVLIVGCKIIFYTFIFHYILYYEEC